MSSDSDRVQTVRNAWINRVRDEALRMRRPEVSKAAHIGVWLASYADADGTNAFPSAETLAAIAGCTDETVTRCVKLLLAVGLLERKRRPNKPTMYTLLIPLKRPDWDAHMHVWGESRQARARRKAKAKEMAELLGSATGTPSGDGNRTPSPDGERKGAEPVPGGEPDTVPGGEPTDPGTRPRTPVETVPGRIPDTVPGGGDQFTPTSGRDPQPDHDSPHHSPKPQKRAGEPGGKTESPAGEDTAQGQLHPLDFTRCASCGDRMMPRPGRDRHAHCPPVGERKTA